MASESDDMLPSVETEREDAEASEPASVSIPRASASADACADICYDSCSDLLVDHTVRRSDSMSSRTASNRLSR